MWGKIMKIQKIETILTCPGRNYLIVKITTDNGIVGYGDATLNGRELVVKTLIDEYLSRTLVGMEANRITDVWNYVFKSSYWRGGPVQMTALAGVDMALWDIKGKAAELPVYELLGGKSRNYIDTYMHVHGHNYEALKENISQKIKNGLRVLRYSFDTEDMSGDGVCYRQPHQDVTMSRIEVDTSVSQPWDAEQYYVDLIRITDCIRRDFGENISLIHDTHGRLDLRQATIVAKELERSNLLFWEDSVDPFCKTQLEHIRNISSVPIGIGELYNTIGDYSDIIKNNYIDYVRADISHFGGITAIVNLAKFADAFSIKTALHGPSDISPIAHSALMNVDLSIPNFGIQEVVEFSGSILEVFDSPVVLQPAKGTIKDRPGLGVKVNEEAAAKYPYKRLLLPNLRDKMGAVHNW